MEWPFRCFYVESPETAPRTLLSPRTRSRSRTYLPLLALPFSSYTSHSPVPLSHTSRLSLSLFWLPDHPEPTTLLSFFLEHPDLPMEPVSFFSTAAPTFPQPDAPPLLFAFLASAHVFLVGFVLSEQFSSSPSSPSISCYAREPRRAATSGQILFPVGPFPRSLLRPAVVSALPHPAWPSRSPSFLLFR